MYTLLDGLARYVPRCTRLCRSIRCSCKSGSYSCHVTPSTPGAAFRLRSDEHTAELQSRRHLRSFPTRRSSDLCAAMHPAVQVNQVLLQIGLILLPRYAIDPGRGFSLEGIKAFPQPINGQVVEECGEPHLLIFPCCFPHTRQPLDRTST